LQIPRNKRLNEELLDETPEGIGDQEQKDVPVKCEGAARVPDRRHHQQGNDREERGCDERRAEVAAPKSPLLEDGAVPSHPDDRVGSPAE
jgi:hypothetical protein